MNPQDVMDATVAFGGALQKAGLRIEKIAHLRRISDRVCGNCHTWMRVSCPREQSDARTGQKVGPSCGDTACDEYVPKPDAVKAMDELNKMLSPQRTEEGE